MDTITPGVWLGPPANTQIIEVRFIRIDDTVINLNQICTVESLGRTIILSMAGGREISFGGEEADALTAFFFKNSVDVIDIMKPSA